ncbi:MAG TPA: hypothetical protein PL151_07730 [Phycisphaerae bacterium]|nr:hypothetical protein [Phycisphaerae bacterium]HOJ75290.1 hypothetical protein [Phycisphaerae bacterium]HOM53045.1 hypothetical protein [Phycisphaerae bacterium]HON66982.1 hypothetical protein [Phycisphaerae bacterium]HOQ87374.1 hypothetical protein [Phycisphaerae bacterium]
MQMIQFAVVREARFRSVDGFHVCGDHGKGTIDWAHPLTPRRLLFWDDALPMQPHLQAGHLMGHHLDSIFREGHLAGTHLLDRHGEPAGVIIFEAGPYVFGRFKHVVWTQDELGNQTYLETDVHETLINSYPPAASNFRVEHFDEQTGVMTFSFKPSQKLVG